MEEYYNPLNLNLINMEKKYVEVPSALDVVKMIKQEISVYQHHSDDYSYVFYGMRNRPLFIDIFCVII
ncbi:hypothetical protein [Cytobacillus purgationiresistens]|nr:hypothetical protein [Cytobacillus purgationiresistens]